MFSLTEKSIYQFLYVFSILVVQTSLPHFRYGPFGHVQCIDSSERGLHSLIQYHPYPVAFVAYSIKNALLGIRNDSGILPIFFGVVSHTQNFRILK